jgi:hypothetical protein
MGRSMERRGGRRRMLFLLLWVVITWDVKEGFFWVGSFWEGVEGCKGTGATLIGESDGGAGGDVGHSERKREMVGHL